MPLAALVFCWLCSHMISRYGEFRLELMTACRQVDGEEEVQLHEAGEYQECDVHQCAGEADLPV